MKWRLFVLVGDIHRGSRLYEFLRGEFVNSEAPTMAGYLTLAISALPLNAAMWSAVSSL